LGDGRRCWGNSVYSNKHNAMNRIKLVLMTWLPLASISCWAAEPSADNVKNAADIDAATKETPKPPELKVLEKLIGNWTSECTEQQQGKETRLTATMTVEWILDGHFVQCWGTRNPEGTKNLQIIGFDSVKKEYCAYFFDSSGSTIGPATGHWDEDSQTLTWRVNPQNDVLFLNKIHFIDNDTSEWRMVASRKDGTVLFEQQGKSLRKLDSVVSPRTPTPQRDTSSRRKT
jgi:hypothetical protein